MRDGTMVAEQKVTEIRSAGSSDLALAFPLWRVYSGLLLLPSSLIAAGRRSVDMKKLAALFLLASAAWAADLSGQWTGAFHANGGDGDIPQLLILKQQGTAITGSGGPDAREQYPITKGTVAGDQVKFEVNTGKRDFVYDLKANGKKLRGSIAIKSAGDTHTADVWLERSH